MENALCRRRKLYDETRKRLTVLRGSDYLTKLNEYQSKPMVTRIFTKKPEYQPPTKAEIVKEFNTRRMSLMKNMQNGGETIGK